MRIRGKILVAVLTFYLGTVAAIYLILDNQFSMAIQDIEQVIARNSTSRVLSALRNQAETVDHTAADWALRNGIHALAADRNQSLLDATGWQATLPILDVDLFAVTDSEGRMLLTKLFDPANDSPVDMPESIVTHLSPQALLVAQACAGAPTKGFLAVPQGIFLVVARPIPSRNTPQTPCAALIMGRWLDQHRMDSIGSWLQVEAAFHLASDPAVAAQVRELDNLRVTGNTISVGVDEKNLLTANTYVRDIYGADTCLLSVGIPRMYMPGLNRGLNHFLVITIVLVAILAWFVYSLIDRALISRIALLGSFLRRIRTSADFSLRLCMKGRDEISELSAAVDHMLAALEHDRNEQEHIESELRESESRFRGILENSRDTAYRLNLQTRQYEYMGPQIAQLIGVSSEQILAEGDQGFKRFTDPEDLARLKLLYDAHRASPAEHPLPSTVEYRVRDTSGNLHWVADNFVTILDETGRPIAEVGNMRDVTEAKKAQEALRDSEERFRSILENSRDVAYKLDVKTGKYEYISPSAIVHLGYSAEEIKWMGNDGYRRLIHPEDAKRLQALFEDMALTSLPYATNPVLEYRILDSDGRYRWIADSHSTVCDNNGEAVFEVGSLRDITQERQARETLRASETKYRMIADSVTDIIWTISLDMTLTYVSPAIQQVLGYRPQEIMELGLEKILTPEAYQATARTIQEGLRIHGGSPPDEAVPSAILLDHIRKDGTVLTCEVRPGILRDEDGNPLALVGVTRDMTERLRAELALEASERRFRDTLETIQLAAVILDREGCLVYCNSYFLDKTGKERNAALGQNWFDAFIAPPSRDTMRSTLQELIASKPVNLHVESLVLGPQQDAPCLFQWDLAALRGPDDAIIGMAAIGRDVTEQRRLEEQLRQAQKMEAVGKLAGGIAHDFNNILAAILGHANLIEMDSSEGTTTREAARIIEKAAQQASELTRQLLGFARKGKNQNVPVDLHAVIQQVSQLLSRAIDRNITIAHELAAQTPITLGDPNQIEQILLNLAVNARDAMPSGGTLTFKTNVVDLDEDYCRHHPGAVKGRYVRVTVSDTGCGIPKHDMPRIFEPFFTTKEQGKGTGLGLAMVYGITKNHGGFIHIDSEVNRGTTVELHLPLTTQTRPQPKTEERQPPPPGAGRILIVDDEPGLRDLLARMLGRLGYQVFTAENGLAAIQRYQELGHNIDLVILDMIMPVLGGQECFRELKKINQNVRAILSTGYGIEEKAQEILQEGVLDLIQKPYRFDVLAKAVSRALGN